MCPSCDTFFVLCSQGSEVSDVISRELHSQAQERLQHYFMGRALEERAQQHREALMARISTNIEQLMSMCSFHFCFLKGTAYVRFCDIQIFRRKTPFSGLLTHLLSSEISPSRSYHHTMISNDADPITFLTASLSLVIIDMCQLRKVINYKDAEPYQPDSVIQYEKLFEHILKVDDESGYGSTLMKCFHKN